VSRNRRGKDVTCIYTDERRDLVSALPNRMFDENYCAGMSLGRRLMRLALVSAFDLGRVQRIDVAAALVLALLAHPQGERQRRGERGLQRRVALDLARDVASHPAEKVRSLRNARLARFELLGVRVSWWAISARVPTRRSDWRSVTHDWEFECR
jgi:hypothetical protein